MRTKLIFILLTVVLMPVLSIAQNIVDFESQTLGTKFGPPPYSTNSPGDIIFVENLIDVSVQNFYRDATTTHFGYCEIINALPDFGNGKIMSLNDISLQFDFSNIGYNDYYITFRVADFGNVENLQVNGHSPVIIGDLSLNAPGNPAPGVTLWISTTNIAGGTNAKVKLFGKVDSLLIGGQNILLANIQAHPSESNPNPTLKNYVTFDGQIINEKWGSGPPKFNNPADWIFTEDNISVSLHEFFPVNSNVGYVFNQCYIESASNLGFGSGQVMFTDSISLVFDFTSCGERRNWVKLRFADFGGIQNLEINGHQFYIGGLDDAIGNPAPGITLFISRDLPTTSFSKATIHILGNVGHLVIGGEKLALDDICVCSKPFPVAIRNYSDDHEKPSGFELGQNYPNPFNPTCTINYGIQQIGDVEINIYNSLGQKVKTLVNEPKNPGEYSVIWDGTDEHQNPLSSGQYFYTLKVGDHVATKKMILLK